MSKFEVFKLRMTLLRIWFVKNLLVFFELLMFIGIILVLTGQLPETTPLVGEISISFKEIFTDANNPDGDFVLKLLSSVFSILVSVGFLSSNIKRIALTDIKNKKLKMTLVKAGLYFNQNGKLVKKIEEASKMDLDSDGKIGDTDVTPEDLPREGFIPGLVRAGEEFGVIMSAKIANPEDVHAITETANLDDAKKAVESIDTDIKQDAAVAVENVIVDTSNKLIEDPIKTKKYKNVLGSVIKTSAKAIADGVVKAVKATGNFFASIGRGIAKGFKAIFKKREKPMKNKKVDNNEEEQVISVAVKKQETVVPPVVETKPLTRQEQLALNIAKRRQSK